MTPELREQLSAAIGDSRDAMLALALRAVGDTPEMAARGYGEEDLRQLLNGFEALLVEELGGGGGTREFFIGTAIPAMVADGQSPASLVQGAAMFGALVTSEIASRVDADARDDARVWLASFFGAYCRDVLVAATEAEG